MSKATTIEILIAEVEKRLACYKKTYEDLSWRDKVLLLVEVTKGVKEL